MIFPTDSFQESFVRWAVRRNLPILDVTEANERIIDLTILNLKLQAELDAIQTIMEYPLAAGLEKNNEK